MHSWRQIIHLIQEAHRRFTVQHAMVHHEINWKDYTSVNEGLSSVYAPLRVKNTEKVKVRTPRRWGSEVMRTPWDENCFKAAWISKRNVYM